MPRLRAGRRAIKWETTVAEQGASNVHVRDGITEDEFVEMRTARDATLDLPKLIIPSIQVNMRGGHLPEPDESGKRHLKVPLNAFDAANGSSEKSGHDEASKRK